jgi:hypothetical protein
LGRKSIAGCGWIVARRINDLVVDWFIEQSQIGIHKVIRLRDTTLSNLPLPAGSMVESVFKTIGCPERFRESMVISIG